MSQQTSTLKQIEFLIKLADLMDEYDAEIKIRNFGANIGLLVHGVPVFHGELDKCRDAEKKGSWDLRDTITRMNNELKQVSDEVIPKKIVIVALYKQAMTKLNNVEVNCLSTEFNEVYRKTVERLGLQFVHTLSDTPDHSLYLYGYPMQAHRSKDGHGSWPEKTYLAWVRPLKIA